MNQAVVERSWRKGRKDLALSPFIPSLECKLMKRAGDERKRLHSQSQDKIDGLSHFRQFLCERGDEMTMRETIGAESGITSCLPSIPLTHTHRSKRQQQQG